MTTSFSKASARNRYWNKGQTMVEYAMILAAIAVTVAAGFRSLGVHTDRTVDHARRLLVSGDH